MPKDIFEDHKIRLAKTSISSSAFRNQGKPGLIKQTRNFIIKHVELKEFSKSIKSKKYKKYLDQETNKLLKYNSNYNCRWGTARKGLNIFFREVLYNSYLINELKLNLKDGDQLEIPLDSKTMTQIKSTIKLIDPKIKLTVVPIIQLDESASDKFQNSAALIQKTKYKDHTRVDLDIIFWGKD